MIKCKTFEHTRKTPDSFTSGRQVAGQAQAGVPNITEKKMIGR